MSACVRLLAVEWCRVRSSFTGRKFRLLLQVMEFWVPKIMARLYYHMKFGAQGELKLWNTRYYRFLTNLRAEDDWKPHGSWGVGFGPFPCCINDHHWHTALPSPSTIQRNAQKQKRHLTTIPNTDPSLPNTAPEAEDMMGTILVVWPNLPRNKSRSLPKSYKISQLPFPASLSHYQRQVGTSVWISVRLFIVMSFPSFIRAAHLI